MHAGSPLLLLAATFGFCLPAQEEPIAPPVPSSTLLASLRQAHLTVAEAARLVELLPGRPTATVLQASDTLRQHYQQRLVAFHAAGERVRQKLLKLVPAAQRRQLGRDGDAEVATLRTQARALSQQEDLSKETITQQIDPSMQRLGELLLPTRASLVGEPSLAAALAELDQAHGDLLPWHAPYLRSTEGLEMNTDAEKHFAKVPLLPAPPPATDIETSLARWQFTSLPMSKRDQRVLADNEQLRPQSNAEEWAGTAELNRRRYLLGLPLLRIDPKLSDAARDHSAAMLALGFFSHTSPVDGKRTFGDRAAKAGTSASSENIAAGHDTGASAIDGWWYSPGHHRNMLGAHGRTGLGRSDTLWTQLFGG